MTLFPVIRCSPFFALTGFIFLNGLPSSAQLKPGEANPGKAEEYFKADNFKMASRHYEQLVKKDSLNTEYHYKLGTCYLEMNADKKLAVPQMEFVIKQGKYSDDVLLKMAKAYHYALRFDDALKYYAMYKEKTGDVKTDRQIEMCNNGKVLIRNPVNVTFENLGEGVNTEHPDYYPWVTLNEENLIFTSRRTTSIGGKDVDFDGLRPSDIFISSVSKGQFGKTQNLGPLVNTSLDEQAVGIAPDGSQIIVYIDWIDIFGDLLTTKKSGKSYAKTEPLGENINSPELETAGSLTADGFIIFFASKTIGGLGGSDIYQSRLLPDGTWGPKINLGLPVNTPDNEDFPFPYPDGKTLYFCSQGHNSMGGYDLYKSVYDEAKQQWSKPVNLGYPINTPEDNMNISFSATWGWDQSSGERVLISEFAYVSCWRKDSKGDLDIYRIRFQNIDARYTTIKGTLTCKIPAANNQFVSEPIQEAEIVVDNEGGDRYGSYRVKNGKYLMALQPGKYTVTIEVPGYKIYGEKLTIYDKSSFVDMMLKDIVLSK